MATAQSSTNRRRKKTTQDTRIAEIRDKAIETTTMAMAALVPEDKALTEMQKLFVKYWVEGDNIPNAMRRAGYNEQASYGYRMSKMPNILKAKAEYHRLYNEASTHTKKSVLDMMQEAFDVAKTVGEPGSMVSAAREIGRLCGFYEPTRIKVDVNVTGGTVDRLNRLSDEELLKIIESGDAASLLPGPDGQNPGPDEPDLSLADLLDAP